MILAATIDLLCQRPLEDRIKWHGLNISIENDKGSVRKGTDADGKPWRTVMKYPYGYIRLTEGDDGEHVDCYVGPDDTAENVYVVNQNDHLTGEYDEQKCMLNFPSAAAAKKAYLAHYNRPGFFGSMDTIPVDEFIDKVLKTKDDPGAVAATTGHVSGPQFLPFMELPTSPSWHPPSLSNPTYVPVDNPTETDDRFLDVTNRNSKETKEFRRKLTERKGRPEFVWPGTQRIPNNPNQNWE